MIKLPTTSGIYAILNTVNGKQYVGSAVNLRRRWAVHLSDLHTGKHDNRKLQNAFNKYQEPAFVFQVLETCSPEQLIEREQHWIDTLNTVQAGYNLAPLAYSVRGLKLTAEQRARRCTYQQERCSDPAVLEKLAAAARQRWSNPTAREQATQRMIERYSDPAAREQAGQRSRAYWSNPVARDSAAARMRERYSDPAEREQQGQRSRDAWTNPETQARHAEAMQQVWADPGHRERVS